MKKNLFILTLLFMVDIIYAQTLNSTIGVAAGGLSGNLPRGSTVVMIEFETTSDELANHVIDEMNHNLVTVGLIRPVERRRLNTIRSELSLNMHGEVSDDFAQRIGHMLGAQYIILGSISTVTDQYILRFRAITTETATIVWSFSQNIRSDNMLESFLKLGGSEMAKTPVPATTVASASPAIKVYRIGETGPAGGLIFYDKGNNLGGWRYLEAAPVEAEYQAILSVHGTMVDNAQKEIGTGRRNTQLIVETLSRT